MHQRRHSKKPPTYDWQNSRPNYSPYRVRVGALVCEFQELYMVTWSGVQTGVNTAEHSWSQPEQAGENMYMYLVTWSWVQTGVNTAELSWVAARADRGKYVHIFGYLVLGANRGEYCWALLVAAGAKPLLSSTNLKTYNMSFLLRGLFSTVLCIQENSRSIRDANK